MKIIVKEGKYIVHKFIYLLYWTLEIHDGRQDTLRLNSWNG